MKNTKESDTENIDYAKIFGIESFIVPDFIETEYREFMEDGKKGVIKYTEYFRLPKCEESEQIMLNTLAVSNDIDELVPVKGLKFNTSTFYDDTVGMYRLDFWAEGEIKSIAAFLLSELALKFSESELNGLINIVNQCKKIVKE